MFSSPRTFRDATASTEQYQRSHEAPEQRRDAMAARDNCAENVQRFPSLSSDTAPSSPHRRGLQIPSTQAYMYRAEWQLPSPPHEAEFRPQRGSTMSDATQAVKASLAPSIPSLQSVRPPQSFTGSCEPCAVVEAGHSSKPRLVEHNGQAQLADRTVRRRSLRRPQPLQGIGSRSLYASEAPNTPSMSDARSLYGSPGRRPSTFGNETSAVPVRTTGRGSSDLSSTQCGSSSPEADPRKRGKGRLTAEERAASGHIPRPPNSFMLYRSAQNKLLSQLRSQEGDKLQQADLCECRVGKGSRTFLGEADDGSLFPSARMIAQMWHDETPEVRDQYAKQAAAEKAEHALKYPGKAAVCCVSRRDIVADALAHTTRLHLSPKVVRTTKSHQIQRGSALSERQEQLTSRADAGAVSPRVAGSGDQFGPAPLALLALVPDGQHVLLRQRDLR